MNQWRFFILIMAVLWSPYQSTGAQQPPPGINPKAPLSGEVPLKQRPSGSRALKRDAVPVAILMPVKGPWHTFVRITGDRMGEAIGARAVWYPNDDDSQPPL